jgi:hypothetical protein
MPKAAADAGNETVRLRFTVDSGGSVKDILTIEGSQAASDLIRREFVKWKFKPVMSGSGPVEEVGTVRFVKGQDQVTTPPLSNSARTPTPPIGLFTKLTVEMLAGSYRREPPENGWHHGVIENNPLGWTNDAGASWHLTPDLANGVLRTEADNPYYNTPAGKVFQITLNRGTDGEYVPIVEGFQFNGESYRRQDINRTNAVRPRFNLIRVRCCRPEAHHRKLRRVEI